MAPRSFRRDLGVPPDRYRTPSPPREFYERITPSARFDLESYSSNSTFSKRDGKVNDVRIIERTIRNNTEDSKRAELDVFASIALASNSSDRMGRPAHTQWMSSQVLVDFGESLERPAKRPKSEKDVSPDRPQVNARPSTSHIQHSDKERRDAELLLNFSRAACFAIPKRPHYASPPQNEALRVNSQQVASISLVQPPPDNPQPTQPESRDSAALVRHDEPPTAPYDDGSTQADLTKEEGGKSINGDVPMSGFPDINDAADVIPENETNQSLPSGTNGISTNFPTQIDNGILEAPASKNPLGGTSYQEIAEVEDVLKPVLNESETTNQHPSESTALTQTQQSIEETEPEKAGKETGTEGSAETNLVQSDRSVPLKRTQDDTPSICASCNFSRDSLDLGNTEGLTSWINCDGCKSWFHFACAGFSNEREVRRVDKYRCKACVQTDGKQTTFVRKSNRAHNQIDYAGLNEGIFKTSDEDPEHHYIKSFKNGATKFQQETFPRIRPELINADFFEKGDGMKEPIVIPASWNPRPRQIPDPQLGSDGELLPGDELHDRSVLDTWLAQEFEYEIVQDEGQDALDMVIPQDLTVRKVSELYGPYEKIEVIDVKSQNGEDKKWDMRRWVDYYESKENKKVRNVISMEVSSSKLGFLIRRPKIVRDLDLTDQVWPQDLIAKGEFPKVQLYCLMSVADCYTDFHIDFGGSSVFYHILRGKKTFFFIPPHEKHLKKYEEWCNSPAQNWTFLGEQTKECYRVDLSEGDTMLIPAGWIHAVWTPEDSLVIGGNFLTRLHYHLQIRVAQIEKATHVARKFRYPHFQKVLWYTALKYLDEDPIPDSVIELLASGQHFPRDIPTHLEFDTYGESSRPGLGNHHARYYSKAELDGLPDLGRYLQRTALIAMGSITDGITVETRNAVRRSIPKTRGHGEPYECLKKFAMWYTWKRGNENLPHWAYPDAPPPGVAAELSEKKISAKALRKLDRDAAYQAFRVAPDRQSTRPRTQPQSLLTETLANRSLPETSMQKEKGATQLEIPETAKRKLEQALAGDGSTQQFKKLKNLGDAVMIKKKGPACETCRKGRRACKHREELPMGTPGSADKMVINPEPSLRATATGLQVSPSSILKNGHHGPLSMSHVEIVQTTPKRDKADFSTSTPLSPTTNHGSDGSPTLVKTPGRAKACKDCRKSKRRCVHDEFGNADPVKLAEAAIPRPAAKKKRNSGATDVTVTREVILSSVALHPEEKKPPSMEDAELSNANQLPQDDSVGREIEEENGLEPVATIPEDSDSAPEDSETADNLPNGHTVPSNSVPEDEVNLIATSPVSDVKRDGDLDRAEVPPTNVQKPAASSLVSPPESLHTDIEMTPVEMSEPRDSPVPAKDTPLHPSLGPSAKRPRRYTPESGVLRRASTSSRGQASGRGSTSPAEIKSLDNLINGINDHRRKKSRGMSEADTDVESLRLIRELAAQDLGLRRRR